MSEGVKNKDFKLPENIELHSSGGIKCDNKSCDYRCEDVKNEEYKDWINKPCPKCGENLLTIEDYNNLMTLFETVKFINKFTEEELNEMLKPLGHEPIESDKKVKVTFNTHKGLSIDKIEDLPN